MVLSRAKKVWCSAELRGVVLKRELRGMVLNRAKRYDIEREDV